MIDTKAVGPSEDCSGKWSNFSVFGNVISTDSNLFSATFSYSFGTLWIV